MNPEYLVVKMIVVLFANAYHAGAGVLCIHHHCNQCYKGYYAIMSVLVCAVCCVMLPPAIMMIVVLVICEDGEDEDHERTQA